MKIINWLYIYIFSPELLPSEGNSYWTISIASVIIQKDVITTSNLMKIFRLSHFIHCKYIYTYRITLLYEVIKCICYEYFDTFESYWWSENPHKIGKNEISYLTKNLS